MVVVNTSDKKTNACNNQMRSLLEVILNISSSLKKSCFENLKNFPEKF